MKTQKFELLDYRVILKASVLMEGKERVYLTVAVMSGIIDEKRKTEKYFLFS